MPGPLLSDLAADLAYAAGPGAARVAASTARSGELEADTGIDFHSPGPALRSMLARSTKHSQVQAQADTTSAAAIAGNAQRRAGAEGQGLIMGRRP